MIAALFTTELIYVHLAHHLHLCVAQHENVARHCVRQHPCAVCWIILMKTHNHTGLKVKREKAPRFSRNVIVMQV